MKKILFVLISGLFVLAGCNTLEGAGKDIQKAGEKIEDAAKKK
jgi:predicted small secreted protein